MNRKGFVIGVLVILLLSGLDSRPAEGFNGFPSMQGYTGLLNIPNAQIAKEGTIDFLYTNNVDYRWLGETPFSDTYTFSVGLFTFFEVGARFTESPRQARDLSANMKLQIPSLIRYFPNIAVGVQDLKSASPRFRTTYFTASQEIYFLRLTAGYGLGPDRLEGFFGGAEINAFNLAHFIYEYDTDEHNLGARVFTPEKIMPRDTVIGFTAKIALAREDEQEEDLEYEDQDWSLAVSLQMPLGGANRIKKCPEKESGNILLQKLGVTYDRYEQPSEATRNNDSATTDTSVLTDDIIGYPLPQPGMAQKEERDHRRGVEHRREPV